MEKKYLTLSGLHRSRKIWWIRSLPTLKKWVIKDLENNNLLGTIINTDKAPRYYFLPENVDRYVEAFNNTTI